MVKDKSVQELFGELQGQVVLSEDVDTPTLDEWEKSLNKNEAFMGVLTALNRLQSGRLETLERMTADEFFQFAPDEQHAELIDGVMYMSPPPLDVHEREQGFLFTLMRFYAELHDLGEVRGSRTAVRLSEAYVFEPDVLFVAREREQVITERGVMGAPDLVVEILSASTAVYDRGDKFRAYDKYGVREVWLIDPYGPTGTEFYQRQGDSLQPAQVNQAGWLTSLALPGFRLQVAWLWPDGKFIPIQKALAEMGD